MLKVVKRISRIFALCAVYVMFAYGYLTAKGFIFTGNTFILSNQAYADENTKNQFARKVSGEIGLEQKLFRVIGTDTAPLTIFAYSSMACSHCRDFHKFTLPKIERDFIKNDKVKLVFVHFPLEERSMRAAKLSYCLPQNQYYRFISELYDSKDWLFSNDKTVLNKYAQKFGMTDEDIKTCEDNKKLTSDILLVRDNAIKTFGIQGTPSFIIEGEDGKELIVGTRNYDELREYLNKRLQGETNGSDS